MIVLGKDKTLDNYFIDENGVITDQFGNVQKVGGKTRPYFKSVGVHKILMWTNYGYRDTKIWAIHHLDENKLNNSLSNLVFLTRSEHMRIHKKGNKNPNFGIHFSEEHKQKISEAMKGHHFSEETRKKISAAGKGRIWVNNGIDSRMVFSDNVPNGFVKGRLKINRL